MPLRNHLGRSARLATLPERRGLVVATVRSTTLRAITRRTVIDRAGLVLLPGRWLSLGWTAAWAMRRALGRHLDPPVEVREGALSEAVLLPVIVTPGSMTERSREGPR